MEVTSSFMAIKLLCSYQSNEIVDIFLLNMFSSSTLHIGHALAHCHSHLLLLSGERLIVGLHRTHHLRVQRDVDLLLLELLLLLRLNPITQPVAAVLLLLPSLHSPGVVAVTAIAEVRVALGCRKRVAAF